MDGRQIIPGDWSDCFELWNHLLWCMAWVSLLCRCCVVVVVSLLSSSGIVAVEARLWPGIRNALVTTVHRRYCNTPNTQYLYGFPRLKGLGAWHTNHFILKYQVCGVYK